MNSPAWVWLKIEVVRAVHEEQLAEHGGAAGTREEGLVESALTRPQNVAADGNPDACDLAAAYGFGIERKRPFTDGNKRTAFAAVALFLALNGRELHASDETCVLTMLDVAAGALDETAFARWLRAHSKAS